MKLTLSEIAAVTGGKHHGPDVTVRRIEIDSRKPQSGAIFVALRGANFDGHAYISESFNRGAAAALVERPLDDGIPHVVVGDTLLALQTLAEHHRQHFEIPVVGVTGSNGKTIVKEMLAAILAQERTVHRSPGSFNSQVGVPLSLLALEDDHEVAIIEAGISRKGEMTRHATMIRPTHGILTSIGTAHLAGLGDLATTAREKFALFADAKLVVMPRDCLAYDGVPSSEIITFDWDETGESEADLRITWAEATARGFDAIFEWQDGTSLVIRLNVPGRHNVMNAAAAATMAAVLGASHDAIREGLASFELAPMRLELHTTSSGITLINDAYSSDPVSARAAVSTLQFYAGGARTVAIIGDMLDLGARAELEHQQLGQAIGSEELDVLICVGRLAQFVGDGALGVGFSPDRLYRLDDDMDALAQLLSDTVRAGDFVLFKGSRALGLERAAESLLESMAPTRLHIDLDAVRANYRAIRDMVGDTTRIMAVVKSFAYGNDATRVSQTLVREGVDALAVAYPDEAIPLRRKGLQVPILVTNTLAEEADKIVKYELTPLIYSLSVARALDRQARLRNAHLKVHLEVDTGMGRVGLQPSEVLAFSRRLREFEHLEVSGIMTHFAAADDPTQDAYTRHQIATFNVVVSELETDGVVFDTIHAANTAASWRFEEARYDMVRIGLGLYGYHPSTDVGRIARSRTIPAIRFTSRIIHVKEVHSGDSVSYGRTWRADNTKKIATIAVGYNDGFSRFMSNGGQVLIRGHRCPIVGSVCMDVSMVDVSALANVEIGDEVVLFGAQGDDYIGPEELAERGNTINYEILCKIAPRVRRIFSREA